MSIPIKETKKKEEFKVWSIKQVAATTEPAFYNEETEEYFNLHDALVNILNKLEKIERSLGWG